jgi:molybdate transport system regulatory protein
MKIKVRLTILNQDSAPVMGIGTIWLLQRIRRLKSINQAAKEMGLSYVKALKILKNMEACLGRQILIKEIGGKDHGGSELTPFAEAFLELFETYYATVTDLAEQEFQHFLAQTHDLQEEYQS